jgi:hypothetical protein
MMPHADYFVVPEIKIGQNAYDLFPFEKMADISW